MTLTDDQVEALAIAATRPLQPEKPRQTLLEFAGECTVKKKARPVPLDLAKHPPQWYVASAIDAALRRLSRFRRFSGIKPVQDGGTTIMQSLVHLYVTGVLGLPVVAGLPDMRLAGLQWRDKTKALLLDSGKKAWLPLEGPGSEDASNPVQVRINQRGDLYFLGGGASNEAGQAMITGFLLGRDELDSMDDYIAELLIGRLEHHGSDAIVVDTSTIKMDEGSPIVLGWERSTGAHVEYFCPMRACRKPTWWRWSHVEADWSTPLKAAQTVVMRCPHCKETFDDRIRLREMIALENSRLVMRGQEINTAGEVVGPEPETLDWGILWTAVDSPITELEDLAVKYQRAKEEARTGNDAPLRRFTRDRDCRVFVPEIADKEISNQALHRQSLRSFYHKREVPEWCDFITVGQDCQGDRHYWTALGFKADCSQAALIDWGYEYLVERTKDGLPSRPITPEDRTAVLRRVNEAVAPGWPIRGLPGEMLTPARRGVDVGYQQGEVVPWIEENRSWIPVKGVGRDQAARMDRTAVREGKSILPQVLAQRLLGIIDVRQPTTMSIPLANVNGHEMRLGLQTALMRTPGTPGSCWLPMGLKSSDYLLLHLSAEVWTELLDDKGVGEGKWYWRQVRKNQNHLLDCATYAWALALYHREVLRQAVVPAGDGRAAANALREESDLPDHQSRRRHSRLR